MKPSKLIVAGLAILLAGAMKAQVSVNVNIGARPTWGPVVEQDVRYYYLPEVEAYYDIPSAMFIYADNGRWVHRHQLPGRFRDYDLYRGRKIVINDYRGNSPYIHCGYTPRNTPPGHAYGRYFHGNPNRGYYYREYDRQPREEFYKEKGNGHGRGHAYGRNKEWKD
ncbi:hypothetical protein [Parabacteroides sp. FAFU027]|uniref:hypothetical protein n=1 Tax=Parabacteroides sp. FAFU027 TaxID=2922715 RepID=UPI001FAEDD7C|nr:hypothetical protein [Parabacteroides sp. FAFU027]